LDRARSFDTWAADYDRFRPGYPDALFERIADRLALPPRPLVVDLGAGTGRATLAMAERGWHVTAVEPGGPMLDILRARASQAGLVVATVRENAEETGLDQASVDLATAAQAFHWFDKQRAVAEMARVVRPGGGVAVFWNVRDETRSTFVAAYHDLLDRRCDGVDTGRGHRGRESTGESTRAAFEGVATFESPEREELAHDIQMTPAQFMGLAFTSSYVQALPPDEQLAFRHELEALLANHGLTDRPFAVPYRIDLWTARRSDR
jgi:ubiquinone/menaquinone biosynthesis C-methylase UbiE